MSAVASILTLQEYYPIAVTMRDVLHATTQVCQIGEKDIMGQARFANIVHARHVVCAVCVHYGHSYSAIGRFLGGRDHSSIINGHRKALHRPDDFGSHIRQVIEILERKREQAEINRFRNLGRSVTPHATERAA
jgi:chromosomal replication initiation ATPase DnaA